MGSGFKKARNVRAVGGGMDVVSAGVAPRYLGQVH